MKRELLVDIKTNWGIVPKGTVVNVLDDNTPLQQSYRVVAIDNPSSVFGIKKTYLESTSRAV